MCSANASHVGAMARVQSQSGFEVADGLLRLAREKLYPAVPVPASSVARVEGKRALDQSNRCAEVLGEITEHPGGFREYTGIITVRLKRLLRQLDGFESVGLRLVGPATGIEKLAAARRCSKRRSE